MLGVQRSFEDLATPLHRVPFCILDLETTGGSPRDCEITEVGAVRYEGGELTGTFHSLVDPGAEIPPFITVLTGITQAMVLRAPKIDAVMPALIEFLGDAVIVGHNIRFDISFLQAAALRLGYPRLANRSSDTVALARRLLASEVRDFRLGTLAAHLRSPVTPTHRALDDARATAHVFFELLERAGSIGATDLDDLMRLPTARGAPHYGKLRLTEGLPRTPGVYLFHDRTGEVIYIGKAKNLRSRVRSYFYGDRRRRITQMMRDLTRVEHRLCPTEIEASITELRLINAHRPRYNRRSRPPKSTHWVRLTDEPYPRLVVARTQGPPALAYLGPFRRRRTAEQVVHALWDASPIRRCAGRPGSHPTCPHAQIGVAMCPGDGTLDHHRYTAAVAELLHALEHEPHRLLEPLTARMALLAEHRRFEEAAELRDRCGGLTRALETRRAWTALTAAGLIWAEDDTGTSLMIDSGRFAAAWTHPDPPPLTPVVAAAEALPTPATTTAAEELWLLWRWLDRPGVRIVDSTAPLVYPLRPVPSLTRLGGSGSAPG